MRHDIRPRKDGEGRKQCVLWAGAISLGRVWHSGHVAGLDPGWTPPYNMNSHLQSSWGCEHETLKETAAMHPVPSQHLFPSPHFPKACMEQHTHCLLHASCTVLTGRSLWVTQPVCVGLEWAWMSGGVVGDVSNIWLKGWTLSRQRFLSADCVWD